MKLIQGRLGDCIRSHKPEILMELNDDSWNWQSYVQHGTRVQDDHRDFISEYTKIKSDETVCLNDMTGIALAKCLGLPLVSMETSAVPSPKKKRIPDICNLERIEHLYFVDFLKAEKIKS
jgi:hypothetical protein